MPNEPMLIPCWAIADPQPIEAPRFTIMRSGGKSIIQFFLEEAAAAEFIADAKLPKVPHKIATLQYLVSVVEQLNRQGVEGVYVFYREAGEPKRMEVPIANFLDGIRRLQAKPMQEGDVIR